MKRFLFYLLSVVLFGGSVVFAYDYNEWYKLGITYHDNHISVGINGTEADLFSGLYQKNNPF